MKKAEYLKYKKLIQSEYFRKMAALEKFWKECGENNIKEVTANHLALLQDNSHRYNKAELIREALQLVEGEFRNSDIQKIIMKNYPGVNVSSTYVATQLARNKNVKIITSLSKRLGFIYRKNVL